MNCCNKIANSLGLVAMFQRVVMEGAHTRFKFTCADTSYNILFMLYKYLINLTKDAFGWVN